MARARSQEIKVFAEGSGYRPIQRASREQAQMFEALGIWRRDYDRETGALLGYRVIGAEREKGDAELQSIRTTASISAREMDLNVSRSRTRGLRELDRLQRIKDGQEPEDAAERAQAKIRVWPHVGPEKGAILQAWPV